MQNRETRFRDWILYSQSNFFLFFFNVYCLVIKKHCLKIKIKVLLIEKNVVIKLVKSWHLRRINSGQYGIDKEMKKETLNNSSYWKNILYRVVETLRF